jgi:dTDP-4-amino-4,6-dideoxygalactose transaminase
MNVPLLDLKAQYATIKHEIKPVVDEVLENQRFILEPEVEALEQEIAAFSDVRFGIGVSSGTNALLLSLMAAEIGSGDEVITTPYTFFATAGSISRVGAAPVFVDIEPKTYNVDPALIEEKITPKTKAIIPVLILTGFGHHTLSRGTFIFITNMCFEFMIAMICKYI